MAHRKTVRLCYQGRHLHELTFSCYRRMPLLTNDVWREKLARSIETAGRQWALELVGFVFMPEHVHLLRYVDDFVLRDRDTDSNGSLDERLYALQDRLPCRLLSCAAGSDIRLWRRNRQVSLRAHLRADVMRRMTFLKLRAVIAFLLLVVLISIPFPILGFAMVATMFATLAVAGISILLARQLSVRCTTGKTTSGKPARRADSEEKNDSRQSGEKGERNPGDGIGGRA